jgi:hypothetical protein
VLSRSAFRGEVDHQVADAENAYRAARTRLSDARLEVHWRVEVLLHDLSRPILRSLPP